MGTTSGALRRLLSYYLRWGWIKSFLQGKWKYVVYPEIYQWKMAFLMHIPGRIGSAIRLRTMGFRRHGKTVYIGDHVWFRAPWNISFGDDVRVHPTAFLDGAGGIDVGSHVGITSGVQIYSQEHGFRDKDQLYYHQPVRLAKVVIEDDVWVGSGSIITAGVRISQGTVVAAGSVITKDTEPYSVVAGVPARKIGQRE